MKSKLTKVHWGILCLANCVLVGNYYNADMPAALGTTLQSWLGLSDDQFQWQLNALYLSTSLPNLIFPVLSGILIDRFGCGRVLLTFSGILLLGQTLFALGLAQRQTPLLLAGRFLLGLGGETVDVSVARVLTDWFMASDSVGIAMGLNFMAARIYSALNDNVSPRLGVTLAAWVGLGATVLCVVSAGGLSFVNRDEGRMRAGVTPHKEKVVKGNEMISADHEGSVDTVVADVDAEQPDFIAIDSLSNRSGTVKTVTMPAKKTIWTEMKLLGFPFFLLCAATVSLYGATSPFFNISTTFFSQKWGIDAQTAGFLLSLPGWIAVAGNPLTGAFLDRFGHRATSLILSSMILFIGHALLQFSNLYPVYGMCFIGIAYAIFTTSVFSCVPYIVAEHQVATGFGILAVAINLALFVFPLLVAQIRVASADFGNVEHMFMGLCGVGALFSWRLCVMKPVLNQGFKAVALLG
ncbi:major facilitator superfamily domain-containing protein [Chytriomyces sp. MP71]|nr:major facilitator superfamily domain-containing protein [Chytriomyces sp. MP71]